MGSTISSLATHMLALQLMVPIDGASFIRFAGWTGILLVYYLFVGLHASFIGLRTAP